MTKSEIAKLTKEIQSYTTAYAEKYCERASEDITKMAKSAIEQFYDDYEPEHYIRFNNLLRRSYSPIKYTEGNTMYGGVLISSDNMHDNYNGTTEQVAWSGWHGWHGLPYSETWNHHHYFNYQTRAPIDIVERLMKNKTFLNDLKKVAEKEARSQKYTYLKF